MRGLDGKTAIVAGGATLIGQAVAETLAGYGTSVVIADINVPTAKRRPKSSAASPFIRCDLCSDADIAALVKASVDGDRQARLSRQRRLHLSRQWRGDDSRRLVESVRRQHRRLGDADASGAAASEKEQGRDRQFRSISARVAQTGRWVYPVSKAAILQLTRNQAMDLAPDGIRVNAVSPGWTWSNIMVELTKKIGPRPTRWPSHSICSAARRSNRSCGGRGVPAV